jgi:hypothetical protein
MGVMAELVNKAGISNLVQGSFSMKWSRAGARYEFQPSLSPARAEVSEGSGSARAFSINISGIKIRFIIRIHFKHQ